MRYKTIFTYSMLLIMLSVSLTVYVVNNRFKLGIPDIDSICSVKVVPAMAEEGGSTELFFDLNRKEDKAMVNNILAWLRSAKIKDKAEDEITALGQVSTCLFIELNNGNTIRIQPAAGTASALSQRGSMTVNSNSMEGQVFIYWDNVHKPVREFAPELYLFMESGWKSVLTGH